MRKILIIIYSLIILIGCNKEHQFNIKLYDSYDYMKIYNLINEIYENAKNKNIEYFKNIKNIEDDIVNNNYLEILKLRYNKLEYSDIEILEYDYTLEIMSIMDMIIRSELILNYKKYAYLAVDGINLNFCFNNSQIHYQLFIYKDENKDWVLIDFYECR